MTTTIVTTLVKTLRNKPRVWLEGAKLDREGFAPEMPYLIEFHEDKVVVKTDMSKVTPEALGSGTVSRRKRGDKIHSLVELRHDKLFEIFEVNQKLMVTVKAGEIIIKAHDIETDIKEREKRLKDKVAAGEDLVVNSAFHGSGVMDSALHEGLLRRSIKTVLGVVVEKVDKYLDNSLLNNPQLWGATSVPVSACLEDVVVVDSSDLVFMGIPCIGASVAGRAKKKTQFAEQCESSGALIHYVLNFIQKSNPALVVLECVKPYANTVSAHILRTVLSHLGYRLSERIFNGNQFGALENRDRWVLMATSIGLPEMTLESVMPLYTKQATLAECLDDLAANDPQWRPFTYLEEKQVRDKEKGNCFARQLFGDDSDHVNTITREYQKARSSDCFHRHPTNPKLSRLYTPGEHARFKRIPERIIQGLAKTTAHEVLGQSVIYSVFESIGKYIGDTFSPPELAVA